MEITKTLKRYRRRVVQPGSPFRILRKAFLYAKNPVESVQRLQMRNEVLRAISPAATEQVAQMNREGFCRHPSGSDTALVSELAAEIDQRSATQPVGGDHATVRKFWSRLTSPEDLHPESIFVRFAMQPHLVQIATAYMGMVPYLSNIQVLVSFGTDNAKWEESQLWHRDYHDTKTLRFWMYLSDVTEPKHGPFTYLPLDPSRQVPNGFFPGRVSDEAMNACGLGKHSQAVYGKRLNCFSIDTARCYHMGSRVALGEKRIAYLATFNTHASLYPFWNDIRTAGKKLTPLQELLLLPGHGNGAGAGMA